MSEIDFFGYAATLFLLLGTWFSIDKDSQGWAFRLFGSLIWAYIGIRIGLVSLFVSEIVFAGLAFLGWQKWRTEEDTLEVRWDALEKSIASLYEDENVCMNADGSLKSDWDLIWEKEKEKNETVQRQSERKAVAAERSKPRKKTVRSPARRRSKSTDGKRRSRSNAKPRSSKKTRRNV